MTVLAVERISVFHEEFQALWDVSFSITQGQLVAILGANGAGKTTTLRMLSTVLKPTSGTASVMGMDVVKQEEKVRQHLGFYSASTALYPRLSARETLSFFAEINGYPREKIKARVDDLIQRFGIQEYADTRVAKLSSGMKQKVSIARTVVHDPPVLIFDEPTVGLDVLAALDMQKVIRAFRDEGKTILFSTHIMSEAEKLCDRIAIIHAGKIHACDTLQALREATGQHYLEDIFVHYVREARGPVEANP